jgi:cardiolipin synthase
MGPKIPDDERTPQDALTQAGDMSLRVVATMPATAAMFRLDQLISALARKRLWLTDAYYAGTTAYVQALKAASADGVDVRLLLPNATDIPLLRPLSRAGYRPLLEAGIRVFEWNGTMLHAKTSVVDGRWARVGSTNLNMASWLGNCELDAVIEDQSFAKEMEEMYIHDLANATEVVLDYKRKVRAPGEPRHHRQLMASGGGSVGRAAAGSIRIGNTIGAAFTNRRVMESVEARLMTIAGVLLLGLAILFAFFPGVLVYPVIVIFTWVALTLFYKGFKLHRKHRRALAASRQRMPAAGGAREKIESKRDSIGE